MVVLASFEGTRFERSKPKCDGKNKYWEEEMKKVFFTFAIFAFASVTAFAEGGEFGPDAYANIPDPVVMPAKPDCSVGYGAVPYRAHFTQPWGWACRKVAGRISGGEGDGGPDSYANVPEPVVMPPKPVCDLGYGAVPYRAHYTQPWGWACREVAPAYPDGDGNGG